VVIFLKIPKNSFDHVVWDFFKKQIGEVLPQKKSLIQHVINMNNINM